MGDQDGVRIGQVVGGAMKDMRTGSERRGTEGLQGTGTPKGTIRRTGPRSWEHRDQLRSTETIGGGQGSSGT